MKSRFAGCLQDILFHLQVSAWRNVELYKGSIQPHVILLMKPNRGDEWLQFKYNSPCPSEFFRSHTCKPIHPGLQQMRLTITDFQQSPVKCLMSNAIIPNPSLVSSIHIKIILVTTPVDAKHRLPKLFPLLQKCECNDRPILQSQTLRTLLESPRCSI